MKLTGFAGIDPGVRAFILITVAIAYPDLLRITRRAPRIAIGALVFGLVLAGFIAGRNHPHFLTCEDFDISGNFVPENCTQQKIRD